MKKTMSHVYRFIPIVFLLYISQHLVSHISPPDSGMFMYFAVQTCFALDPDADSGDNMNPSGATSIQQTKDSRWVIYDRGDKTDWLRVSPLETKGKQLVIRFNFLRVIGTVVIEVYEADPSADFLEKREIGEVSLYEYTTQSIGKHYVKVYAADQGSLAQYEFSYELVPLSSSTSDVTPTSPPTPTVTSAVIPTPSPMPTEVPTASPTPLPTNTPTPQPTPTEVPTAGSILLSANTPTPQPTPTEVPTASPTPLLTATLVETPIPSASDALSKSDFQVIGEKYGVPFNLLRAISIVVSLNGRKLGDYEVRKIVDDEQLKFLDKIAQDTGRPISEFKGSSVGAMGYIQFMPATFYSYAQDGNGDGIKDPLDPYDSVATAAYFLAQKIAKQNGIEAALASYTDSLIDYEKILSLYQRLESEEEL